MNELTAGFLNASLDISGIKILWLELIRNLYIILFAIGILFRKSWAWPVDIMGNFFLILVSSLEVLLHPAAAQFYFRVFQHIAFLGFALYGWKRWSLGRWDFGKAHVSPQWASPGQRRQGLLISGAAVFGVAAVLHLVGSNAAIPQAFILASAMLVYYCVTRGYTEFWIVWLAAHLVTIPLLLASGLYISVLFYLVFLMVLLWGFVVWIGIQRASAQLKFETIPADRSTSPLPPARS